MECSLTSINRLLWSSNWLVNLLYDIHVKNSLLTNYQFHHFIKTLYVSLVFMRQTITIHMSIFPVIFILSNPWNRIISHVNSYPTPEHAGTQMPGHSAAQTQPSHPWGYYNSSTPSKLISYSWPGWVVKYWSSQAWFHQKMTARPNGACRCTSDQLLRFRWWRLENQFRHLPVFYLVTMGLVPARAWRSGLVGLVA